jgi:hypothetical protein
MRALADLSFAAKPSYVKDDITELRRAFPDDGEFARALQAVTRRLRDLRPDDGAELDHDLEGWWRVKFSSGVRKGAELRIIFRPIEDGFELRAFGHRHDPESIYFRLQTRRS